MAKQGTGSNPSSYVYPNDSFTMVEGATAYGDVDGTMTGTAVGGKDIFFALAGATAYGDALSMTGSTRGGNDTFYGGAPNSDEHFFGDAYSMDQSAKGGDDLFLETKNTANWVYGDAYFMSDSARGGSDTITGGDAASDANWFYQNTSSGYFRNETYDVRSFNEIAGEGLTSNISLRYVTDSRVIGGNDSITGGNAIGGYYHADANNQLYGDFVVRVMGHSSGGSDTLRGGDAVAGDVVDPGGDYFYEGDAYVINHVAGEAQLLRDFATGGSDRIRGGNAIVSSNSADAYVVNQLTGDSNMLGGNAQAGSDIITGGNAQGEAAGTGEVTVVNFIAGDSFGMYETPKFGNDTLTGGLGSLSSDGDAYNCIYGDVGQDEYVVYSFMGRMTGSVLGGNDVITGGGNYADNYLVGDAHTLANGATGGNDTITGGGPLSTNLLVGDAIYSNMDGAPVRGGKDVLISGAGDDQMYGDFVYGNGVGGADRFVFQSLNGDDDILDFAAAEGDRIDLHNFARLDSAFKNYAALMSSGRVTDDGTDLHIDLDLGASSHGSVTVHGLTVAQLQSSMFIF